MYQRKDTRRNGNGKRGRDDIILRPYRNPDYSPRKREQHVIKRVMEERGIEEAIAKETGAGSKTERLRDYMATKGLEEHISTLILTQVFGDNHGVPLNDAQRFRYNNDRDRSVCMQVGKVSDDSESVSVIRKLHKDKITGDIEWCWFNALKPQQVEDLVQERQKVAVKTIKRVQNRKKIAAKPSAVRRKLLKLEQKRNRYGVF